MLTWSARQPFLGNAFVDGVQDHLVLLDCRHPADPLVIRIGLVVDHDQADDIRVASILQSIGADMAVEQMIAGGVLRVAGDD